MASPATSSPLRQRRIDAELTQAELAARAGVSRQLVAAVEAGTNVPAVDAALGLARALGTTVEELFSPAPAEIVSALGTPLREGAPLRVGRVGERTVAAELPDHGVAGATWGKFDATIEAGALRLFTGEIPRGLVLAGCDPALGVAEAMLGGLGASSMLAVSAPTDTALGALARDRVHAAVVHGLDGQLPESPVPVLRIHLARWRVGLGVASRLRHRTVEALLEGRAPIVQRDPGAASQQALARAAAGLGLVVPARGPRAAGHIEAARLAATLRCAAITTEAAAHVFELRFLALEEHTVEIWVAERWTDHPGTVALANVLGSAAFIDRAAQFGGYDLTQCGASIS